MENYIKLKDIRPRGGGVASVPPVRQRVEYLNDKDHDHERQRGHRELFSESMLLVLKRLTMIERMQ